MKLEERADLTMEVLVISLVQEFGLTVLILWDVNEICPFSSLEHEEVLEVEDEVFAFFLKYCETVLLI